MSNTVFFTICAKNYLPYALTLYASFRRVYSEATFFIVLADRLDGLKLNVQGNIKVVEAESLGIEEIQSMAFRYEITEFNTAIKPAAFKYLFQTNDCDSVVYLDPDLYVLSEFREMHELLDSGSAAVLTPHICEPVEDGEKPDDTSMLNAGIYNLGFLALRRSESVLETLNWWHRKLIKDCRIDLPQGIFVDQKWMDLLPALLAGTSILRHPGYNVAYWNLMQRSITKDKGCWYSNNESLRFFHFSGIDINNKDVFSKHQYRFTMKNIGPLKELALLYKSEVQNNGATDYSGLPYAYGLTQSNENIPTIVRRIFREMVEQDISAHSDPYEETLAYCNKLEDTVIQDAGVPINRLMYKVWFEREDLQDAFDLSTLEGRSGFVNWYLCSATGELQLAEAFVEEIGSNYDPATLTKTAPDDVSVKSPPVAFAAKLFSSAASRILGAAPKYRSLYRHLSIPVRHKVKVSLLRQSSKYQSGQIAVENATPDYTCNEDNSTDLKSGALLVGYPKAELGMGEHVRLTAESFVENDVSFGIYNFDHNVIAKQRDERYNNHIAQSPDYKANIFHINADQMEIAENILGKSFFNGRYNIGYWAWELSEFPDAWIPATEMVDEIWAPSRFIQQAISEKARCPVIWMPLAVKPFLKNPAVTIDFGILDSSFVFLFYFDFASFSTRKNPTAPIEAFRQAFKDIHADVQLLIKVMGHDVHKPEIAHLINSVRDDPRIIVIDEVLTYEQMTALVDRCNCFVSLHRSEGFGRGMAEAMSIGKPVIATNYSGNTDFMDSDSAYLVDYSMIPVGEGEYVYWEGQEWADPDVEHAGWLMRQVYENQHEANLKGQAGKEFILSQNSPSVIGQRYSERLKRLSLI